MHGQGMVEDKAHFTNSEQQVQGETVFGQVGASASAVRIGDQCLTVLYPYDARDRFDYDYYRDRHAPALLEMFGPAIARIEMRKGLMSTGGNSPPRFACTANIYVADTEAFAAAAPRSHQRVVDDIARFTSVTPISLMTEVLGAFDA